MQSLSMSHRQSPATTRLSSWFAIHGCLLNTGSGPIYLPTASVSTVKITFLLRIPPPVVFSKAVFLVLYSSLCTLLLTVLSSPLSPLTTACMLTTFNSFPFTHPALDGAVVQRVRHLGLRSVGREFKSCSTQRCVTTLGKLF